MVVEGVGASPEKWNVSWDSLASTKKGGLWLEANTEKQPSRAERMKRGKQRVGLAGISYF
jgi:hypothetical protein